VLSRSAAAAVELCWFQLQKEWFQLQKEWQLEDNTEVTRVLKRNPKTDGLRRATQKDSHMVENADCCVRP